MKKPRVAVLVRTHRISEKLHDLLNMLKTSEHYDLFVLADETSAELRIEGYAKITHSAGQCREFGLYTGHKHVFWQCGDYALYFAAPAIPNYDYYVMIDYDVDFVYRSPAFLEKLIDKFTRASETHYDFIAPQFDVANPNWGWRPAASKHFPVVYNTGIFALIALSKRALEHLYVQRQAEALTLATPEDLSNCEAFCGSALAAAGYNCVSINSLVSGAVNFKHFHPPVSSFKVSHYLLNRYKIENPNIHVAHPVYDLPFYLKKQFEKYRHYQQIPTFLDELETLQARNDRELALIAEYQKMSRPFVPAVVALEIPPPQPSPATQSGTAAAAA